MATGFFLPAGYSPHCQISYFKAQEMWWLMWQMPVILDGALATTISPTSFVLCCHFCLPPAVSKTCCPHFFSPDLFSTRSLVVVLLCGWCKKERVFWFDITVVTLSAFNKEHDNDAITMCRQGHLAMVVLLMSFGADPSILDGEGWFLCYFCARLLIERTKCISFSWSIKDSSQLPN